MPKPLPPPPSLLTDDERKLTLASRLTGARALAGLSQEDAAETLGTSRPPVSNLERGVRDVTALELLDLCRLYKVPLATVTEGL